MARSLANFTESGKLCWAKSLMALWRKKKAGRFARPVAASPYYGPLWPFLSQTTRPGFEPGRREPKSLVLPLHYRVSVAPYRRRREYSGSPAFRGQEAIRVATNRRLLIPMQVETEDIRLTCKKCGRAGWALSREKGRDPVPAPGRLIQQNEDQRGGALISPGR
jgi:hypothetical protein